jgi:hypothetical protein
MLQDDQMVFCGEEISDQVIRLQAGWNLCPVLNDDSVEAALVFDDVSTFKMVMEVAGWNMYWPDYNIHTLVYLKSGHSYYAYMNTADDIDFDVPSAKSQDEPEVFVNVSPWNDVTPSPGNHAIAFAPEACKLFAQGDVIGAFTSAGYCAGMVNFNGESFGLVLNPDDAITNAIDGFTSDEPILLKLYRPSTGQIYQLDVAWDETLDNSGSFHNYSLSAVTDVKMSTLGIAGVAGGGIQIYPNPSHGSFTIDGLLGESQIIIYNSFGEQLFTQKVEGSSTRVEMETQAKGVYLIKIETLNGIYHHKVIIN